MHAHDLALLRTHARTAAHPAAAGPDGCGCAEAVLADREDGTVVRHGPVVVKAHAPGTGGPAHRARVAVAADRRLREVLLPPLPSAHGTAVDGRPVTAWPYGAPVDPGDPDAAPWEEAARLLALLHRTPAPAGLPPMRARVKVALAVERMRAAGPHPAAGAVLRARETLPAPPAAEAGFLCHGDFHLGQLVRAPGSPGDGSWRLIDVDDLGTGDPAWDLARPAAWFAAGLLPPDVWSRFLGAYLAAGGPAVAPDDPWAQLDVPARALTVQTAALAIAKSTAQERSLDEVESVMIDTCVRIGALRTELAPPASP
ncbi:phosphotransferase [Streptomyces sp. NPDC008121]|uniref:phosphotransferase family protein n=1 Tax=Streptomyces sp. NPDC008121 TaxID=3364809 RepID=UPI0036ED2D1E